MTDMESIWNAVLKLERSDVVQILIIAGFAWFLLRSRAIRALGQTIKVLDRKVTRLEGEVKRLRDSLLRFGCRRQPCADRLPMVDDVNLDAEPCHEL